jgi:hypothetical protein
MVRMILYYAKLSRRRDGRVKIGDLAFQRLQVTPSAFITASCSAGRTCLIFSFARVG